MLYNKYTLESILNSLQHFTNASAKFSPECEPDNL